MSIEAKKPDGVIFAMIRSGEILTEIRVKHKSNFFGEVILPGGAIEEGETSDEAVKREIKEECGVVATRYHFVENLTLKHPKQGRINLDVYVVEGWEGELTNVEYQKGVHLELPIISARKILYETGKTVLDVVEKEIHKNK